MEGGTIMKKAILCSLLMSCSAHAEWLAFGDSITASLTGYVSLIQNATGWIPNNQGVPGTQVADLGQIGRIMTNIVTADTRSTWLVGYNDMRYFGALPAGRTMFRHTVSAGILWLTLPEESRVRAQSTNMVLTGPWTNGGLGDGQLAMYTEREGATATATVAGTVVYVVGLASNDPRKDTFTVTVDGVDSGTFHFMENLIGTTDKGRSIAPFVARIPGLPAGAHSVKLTAHTNGSAGVWLQFIAGNDGPKGPMLWLGNCLRMVPESYGSFPPFNMGSDEQVLSFNQDIADLASLYSADGLGVILADASAVYTPESGVGPDKVHPNAAGNQQIADAFLNAIAPRPTLSIVGNSLHFASEIGRTYRVQASDDFTHWISEDLLGSGGDIDYSIAAPDGVKFFRVIRTVTPKP